MSNVTGCTAHDPARRAIRVGGAESADFLQSILTSDVEALAAGEIRASALLTPQGRILADMMVLRVEDGFLLDCDTTRADDLFTRLRRYRLRRPITLEQLDDHQLWVGWDGAPAPEGAGTDPRHPALGWRWIGTAGTGPETASGTRPARIEEWHALRIAAGVPQGPVDLQPERALMLEAGLDRLGAVDFEKGCYVGQEVTARTHYRGLVKRRIVPLTVAGGSPESGAAVTGGGRDLGAVLSVAATDGGAICLAAMKLSDIHRIGAGDLELSAGGRAASLAVPEWMLPLPDPSKTDTG
ncbi:MAG: folate-binding protein [Pseudomonadota bacterium]|nr:folate-binding protein [Pseudomonadota bacterium]MEC8262241.1 folate-binding protein [Pseudomonadota bacterium]